MSRITRRVSLLTALALALSPVVLSAFAVTPAATAAEADAVTWSVEPVLTADGQRRTFEYSVDPGTQILDSIVITNSGPTAAEFLIYATDAINEYETGAFGLLKREDAPTDLGSWITTASDKLTIQPGSQATVPFNLLVPSDAAPGDHVAGIVAAVLTKGESGGAAVTLEQRVGARVYLDVSGAPEAGVELAGVTSGFAAEFNPFAPGTLEMSYEVRNTGNQRIDVDQSVTVAGPFGIPLGELRPKPIPELLPRQTVRVTAEIPAVMALLLAWSTVTLVPAEVGTLVNAQSEETEATPTPTPTPDPSATPAPEDPNTVDYEPASSTVMTAAISWTMLAVLVAVLAVAYLVWRYVAGTRERMYLAIDEAAAAAREEALAANDEHETVAK